MSTVNVQTAVKSIEENLRQANSYFLNMQYGDRQEGDDELAEAHVESALIELLVLAESLQLTTIVKRIEALLTQAQTEGFLHSKMGPEDPYLVWGWKARLYLDAIAASFGLRQTDATEMSDVKQILQRALYFICDDSVFGSVPQKESDVHDRLEGVLKSVYPDLQRKPPLTKPIKNFEPDTGIPSIKTLIEYKFVDSLPTARLVVDQILADTQGYRSPSWKNLLFVIYEAKRVKREDEWKMLLKECELVRGFDVIVLPGEARSTVTTKARKKPSKAR